MKMLILLALTATQAKAPRAIADGQTLEGFAFAAPARGAAFLGIPYAEAPVHQLRWRPPVQRKPSAGVLAVRAAGASCAQPAGMLEQWAGYIYSVFGHDSVPMPARPTSEDCLFLNVWTTNLAGPAAPQPVMVWLHGGSNIMGEGTGGWTDGTALAARGVVVVSLNYRLGVLGFLAHPGLSAESPQHSSGNYGLLDQLEALRWVHRNIAAFGGDPARVTVFGESAGANDVLHLTGSPLSAGLFQRAIAQSGVPMGPMPRLPEMERRGVAFMAALGLDSTAGVAALRRVPADRLIAAQERTNTEPVVDGWVLPDVTGRRLDQRLGQRVALLVGSNALEGTTLKSLFPRFERTVAGYRAWLKSSFGLLAASVEALYPARDDAAVEPALTLLVTDLYFTCQARFAARASAGNGMPAWLYYFTRVHPGGEVLGAYHGMEIRYAFGTRDPNLPGDAVDERLSNAMMSYWTRFAATGDPNVKGLPEWPAYGGDPGRHLELGDTVKAGSGLKADACRAGDLIVRALWGPPV